jgi:hypothetical protein
MQNLTPQKNKKSGAIKIFLGLVILALGIYSDILNINPYIGYMAFFIGPLIFVKGSKDYYRKYPKILNKGENIFFTVLTIISFLILIFGFYLQTKIVGGCTWGGHQTNPWCDFGLWLAFIPAIGMFIYIIVLLRIIISKNA